MPIPLSWTASRLVRRFGVSLGCSKFGVAATSILRRFLSFSAWLYPDGGEIGDSDQGIFLATDQRVLFGRFSMRR